jgi:hypothetical protein
MQAISDQDIGVALCQCDGNLAEVAQALGTDTATVISRIRASKDLTKLYAVALGQIRSLALVNVINGIRRGDVADSKWWLEHDHRLFVDDYEVLPFG